MTRLERVIGIWGSMLSVPLWDMAGSRVAALAFACLALYYAYRLPPA